MENPTYKQAYRIFESMGFGVTTVNMDKSGMDVQKLQESRGPDRLRDAFPSVSAGRGHAHEAADGAAGVGRRRGQPVHH